MNENQRIAKIIHQQMGGRLRGAIGATNLVAIERGLQFSFKMCRTANKCVIRLNGLDLYDMTFYKLRGADCVCTAGYHDQYAEQLIPVFESETGLYLVVL